MARLKRVRTTLLRKKGNLMNEIGPLTNLTLRIILMRFMSYEEGNTDTNVTRQSVHKHALTQPVTCYHAHASLIHSTALQCQVDLSL